MENAINQLSTSLGFDVRNVVRGVLLGSALLAIITTIVAC